MEPTENTFDNFPHWVLEKWQDIADVLAETIDIPAALIIKTENEFMEVFISSHSENNPYSVGAKEEWYGMYCETVIKTQNKLLIQNATKDKVWDKNPDIKTGMIAYLGFPINFPDNQPFGTLCILDNKERPFTVLNEKLMLQFKNVIELDLALLQSFEFKTRPFPADFFQEIPERKQMEAAMRHSQDFMNSIIEKSPTSLWISDAHGTLIRMNQACRDILHLQDEEVVGKYNIFNDNIIEKQGFMPLVRDVFEKGATVRFVISYDTAAVESLELGRTTRIDLDVNISPIIDSQGKVINAIIQHIDITERKQAEEESHKQRDILQSVFDHIPVMISYYNQTGKFEMINREMVEKLGWSFEDWSSESILAKCYPDPEAFKEALDFMVNKPAGWKDFKTTTKYGTEIITSWTNITLPNGVSIGLGQDITERKLIEEKINRHTNELAALLKISQELAATLNLESILQVTADRATELMEIKTTAVYLLEGETIRLWATTPPLPQQFPEELRNAPLSDHPHIRQAITTGLPVFMHDSLTAVLTPAEREICEIRGLRSILYIPLKTGTKVLGALILSNILKPLSLSEADINLCNTLANLASLAVVNAQLFKSEQDYAIKQREQIAELVQTEEKLKKSEQRFRDLFNLANEGLVLLTMDGEIAEVNQSFAKIHGYTVDGIRKMNIRDLDVIGDGVFDARTEEIKRIFAGEVVRFEVEHYHKDGHSFFLNNTVSLITIEQQQYFLSFHHDITERKQVEEKIREKDIQFRKLSANVSDLIFQFTRRPDGTYCVPIASEGIKNIFGCSPEDVLDDFTPIGRVIHPDDADRVISDIEYSAEHLTYFTCEFRVQIPGKGIQWIFSRSSPEKLPDGSITWYGFNADITERKRAEEIREIQYNIAMAVVCSSTLKELFNQIFIQLEKLFDTSNFFAALYNPETDTLKKLQWVDEKDVFEEWDAGKSLSGYVIKTAKTLLLNNQGIEKLAAEQNIPIVGSPVQCWLGSPLISDNKTVGVIVIKSYTNPDAYTASDAALFEQVAFDISIFIEKHRTLQELKIAKEHAEESDRLKTAFLLNMSHEIRTPMNGILGFSNLLKEPGLTGEEQQEYIEVIEKSGERMLNIISEIIDISKIESGQVVIHFHETNINEKIENVYNLLKPDAEKKRVNLSFKNSLPAKEAFIVTDKEKLYSILTNLVKNAI